MKKVVVLIGIFAISLSPLFAGSNEEGKPNINLQTIQKIFEQNLSSSFAGIPESSMIFALQIRLTYPDANLQKIENALVKLSQDGKTEEMRYRAYVVLHFFQNPHWLSELDQLGDFGMNAYDKELETFDLLATTLLNKMIWQEINFVSQQ